MKQVTKNPLAAAGIGLLLGAGISGLRSWNKVKEGEMSKQEAVAVAIKQGILFGGVTAVSSLAGGSKGGGASLLALSALGMKGGQGAALPDMLLGVLGGAGGGKGGGGGQGGGKGGGGGQNSGLLDLIAESLAGIFAPKSQDEAETAEVVPKRVARNKAVSGPKGGRGRGRGAGQGRGKAALPDDDGLTTA